jgi:hypothetical protein
MVLKLPLNGTLKEEEVVRAQDALDTARGTADAATAEVKDVTDKLANAQALLYNALLVVAGHNGENLEAVKSAQQAYDDANKAVTLATNNVSAAKMAETKAERDYKEALTEYSSIWSASKTGDTVGNAHADTQGVVKKEHADTQGVVKKEHGDTQGVVKKEHADTQGVVKKEHGDTRKTVAVEADNGRQHSSQATYEHNVTTRAVLGNQINAVSQAVKGMGSSEPSPVGPF